MAFRDLLRQSASDVGNDHRLGANEAPPAIISMFLGEQLEDVVKQLVETGIASTCKEGGVLETVRAKRPVVVLTGTIDTRKRFLMEQTPHIVTHRYPLHGLHDDLIVIHRDIRRLINGRQFMLRRRNLIVLCGSRQGGSQRGTGTGILFG